MNLAQALPLADAWGTRGGWGIAMCVLMMVCMAVMMLGMGRMGTGSEHRRPAPWDRLLAGETPEQVLDRCFAEGAISLEDYELRRQLLAEDGPPPTGPSEPPPPPAVGTS